MSRKIRRSKRSEEDSPSSSSSSRSRSSSSSSAELARARKALDVISEIFPKPAPNPATHNPGTASLAEEGDEEPQGEATLSSQELAVLVPLPPSPTPKKAKQKISNPQIAAQMPPLQPIPLLVCSIGNPGAAYANTLHSAGHTVLASLATYISASSFQKDRAYANGLVSQASYSSAQPLWTLFQSPSYMNESGKPILKAYQTWVRSLGPGAEGKVVILHDELEKPLGAVSVREGHGLSARGHNGLKSLSQQMGKVGFVRIGVGIGRPVSREPNDVAKFVLKKMTPGERDRVEGAASEILERLRGVSGG